MILVLPLCGKIALKYIATGQCTHCQGSLQVNTENKILQDQAVRVAFLMGDIIVADLQGQNIGSRENTCHCYTNI